MRPQAPGRGTNTGAALALSLAASVACPIAIAACGGGQPSRAPPANPPTSQPPPAVVPPQPASIAASAPELRWEGRFDRTDPAGPRFQWPGSAVWLRFTGTSAKVALGEHSLESDDYGQVAHDWYDVTVDGQLAAPLVADEGTHVYPLASGLTAGEHLVVLRRRTEAYVGDGQLLGFELDPGAHALPAPAAARRIEFIGDSITAGFGVDGPDAHCGFSSATENYSHSYAALTAQALAADQTAIAATGEGVYRNWGGSTDNTIGVLYLRTLPTHASSTWDISRWSADAVVIDLGTNDFSSGDPGSAAFTGAYRALIARVRQNYPGALIVVALGPMLSDLWPVGAMALTQARVYLTSLVNELNAAGDARVKLIEFPNQDGAATFGCRSHPSAATHRQMADQLTAFLRQQLGW